ncbi:MAG: molybdenum cofactor biosynthesis protein [Planctomycetes bacterium]|nr:molybdenum cofactor biosynthesis protein [Planctomycetota bacterium]
MNDRQTTSRRGIPKQLRCTVITASDTRTIETDESGQLIARLLVERGHAVVERTLVPEEPGKLALVLRHWLAADDLDVVLVSGADGPGAGAAAVDVVRPFLETEFPGFAEILRMLSFQEIGSAAMALRVTGGTARGKLVFSLPAAARPVQLGMEKLILPELRYLVREIRRAQESS